MIQCPALIVWRHKPTEKKQGYIQDANKEYIVGLTKKKTKDYEKILKALRDDINDGKLSKKSEAIARVQKAATE